MTVTFGTRLTSQRDGEDRQPLRNPLIRPGQYHHAEEALEQEL
jgi:hypothetical protein